MKKCAAVPAMHRILPTSSLVRIFPWSGHCHAPEGTLVPARQVTFQVGDVGHLRDRLWRPPLDRPGGHRIRSCFPKFPCVMNSVTVVMNSGKIRLVADIPGAWTNTAKSRRYLPNIMRPGESNGHPGFKTGARRFRPFSQGMGPAQLQDWAPTRGSTSRPAGPGLPRIWTGDISTHLRKPFKPDFSGVMKRSILRISIRSMPVRIDPNFPASRIRCFAARDSASVMAVSEPFSEVPMNLDTLWVDMDREALVLVWRGWTQIFSEDFEEIQHLLIAAEPLEQKPESQRNTTRSLLLQRLRDARSVVGGGAACAPAGTARCRG